MARRPPPGFDPYEAAGDRLERARQARQEIGDPQPHLPPELRIGRVPRASTRTVLVALGLFLTVGVVAVTTSPEAEQPDGDCDTAAVSVRPETTAKGLPVTWFATGPEGRYVLTVGVAELRVAPSDHVAPEPSDLRIARADAGNERDASIEGGVFTMAGCRGTGRFLMRQRQGQQTVRVYRLDGVGPAGGTAEQVADTRLNANGRTA